MAARTGERSTWVERTRQAAEKLERSQRAEDEALGRLPYSREELERAFEDLKAAHSATAQPGTAGQTD
jgi:hypothetical protein